ncbi:hypothetical protein DFS34DRAFT_128334 [Phlyctochytrium arcticum]|nr:hypothetical protein DFS34DRAFT_128334 [Phlyctochytrium arcticum]
MGYRDDRDDPYRRVYIGKLPNDVSRREVERLTDEFGPIDSVRILSGYAFVEFAKERDAERCVRRLDGERFDGYRLIVQPARSQKNGGRDQTAAPRGSKAAYRITVSNMPERTSWQDLKDLMRKAGEVVYTDINREQREGLVEFSNEADMENALRMFQDYEFEGKVLTVAAGENVGKPRDGDSRSTRRRSRSPPPARRRSRSRSPRRRSASPRAAVRDDARSPSVKGERSPSPPPRRSLTPQRSPTPENDDSRRRSTSPRR